MVQSLYGLLVSCLALLSLAGGAASFNIPFFDVSDPAFPQITQAPSAAALDLRLRDELSPRTVMTCATACIDSAVTKSTTCRLNDLACECQYLNIEIIYEAAYACLAQACGYLVAANVISAASEECLSINAGLTTFTDFDTNGGGYYTTDTEQTTAVVVVTRTNAAGSVITSTAYVGSSTPGSSGGSGNGGGGDSGLSKTATIGIAVGSAGGAIILCALLFIIYKCCTKRDKQVYAPVVPAPPEGDAAQRSVPATAAVAIPAGKPELAGESKVYAVTPTGSTPSPANQSDVSRHPSIMSTATTTVSGGTMSPIQGYAPIYNPPRPSFPAGPPVHEMQVHPYPGYAPGYMPPPAAPVQNPPSYGQLAQPVYYAQPQGSRPEVMGDTQLRPELHGQAYGSGTYEMSSTPAPPR
ncbi:hypothetical protein GQ53DRAFT_837122 [Thozetella sp. PMI_491]|nr:hypothetical protein GQ53DRAFT_837122 [Thozetella sp. PMI_491]